MDSLPRWVSGETKRSTINIALYYMNPRHVVNLAHVTCNYIVFFILLVCMMKVVNSNVCIGPQHIIIVQFSL
jgi:hypothetical protein